MVGPRKELVDLTVLMAIDDPGEDVGQVGERIDLVQLAGLDQGCDDDARHRRPSLRTTHFSG